MEYEFDPVILTKQFNEVEEELEEKYPFLRKNEDLYDEVVRNSK